MRILHPLRRYCSCNANIYLLNWIKVRMPRIAMHSKFCVLTSGCAGSTRIPCIRCGHINFRAINEVSQHVHLRRRHLHLTLNEEYVCRLISAFYGDSSLRVSNAVFSCVAVCNC
jgi:hypothetical protein